MPRNVIFVDTSAWYAIIDENDQDHAAALGKIRILDRPLITSNYIFDETLTLLKSRLGSSIAIQFGQKLWNQEVSALLRITEEDEEKAWTDLKTLIKRRIAESSAGSISGKTFDEIVEEEFRASGAA